MRYRPWPLQVTPLPTLQLLLYHSSHNTMFSVLLLATLAPPLLFAVEPQATQAVQAPAGHVAAAGAAPG